MIRVDVDPILIGFGPFAISWYGLFAALAIAAGVGLTRSEARRRGLPDGSVLDVVLWVVVGGLLGARILHVVDRWDYYAAHPYQIIAVQNGGLAILGGIAGGIMAGAVAALRAGLPVRRLFDAAAPGAVLGQAIGRLGCLVTGDSVGPATDGTWGVAYANPRALAPELGVAYQPTFLYEAGWDLVIFALLWTLRNRALPDGRLFGIYLSLYAIGKFLLTYLRTETIWLAGLQQAHLVALGALVVAVAWLAWRPTTPLPSPRSSE